MREGEYADPATGATRRMNALRLDRAMPTSSLLSRPVPPALPRQVLCQLRKCFSGIRELLGIVQYMRSNQCYEGRFQDSRHTCRHLSA